MVRRPLLRFRAKGPTLCRRFRVRVRKPSPAYTTARSRAYSYIWNSAENATTYNSLTYGVMFQELAMNMRAIIAGTEPFKMRLYSGHDGGMVRLASGLGLGKPASDGRLRWPALGSEIVFEVRVDLAAEDARLNTCRCGSSRKGTRRISCLYGLCTRVLLCGRSSGCRQATLRRCWRAMSRRTCSKCATRDVRANKICFVSACKSILRPARNTCKLKCSGEEASGESRSENASLKFRYAPGPDDSALLLARGWP